MEAQHYGTLAGGIFLLLYCARAIWRSWRRQFEEELYRQEIERAKQQARREENLGPNK